MKKLSSDQLQKLQDLKKKFDNVIFNLGDLEAKIYTVNTQLESLTMEKTYQFKDYNSLLEEQNVFTKEILEEFGAGIINIETGEIGQGQ